MSIKRSPLQELQLDIVKAAQKHYPAFPASDAITPIMAAVALLAADLASRDENPDAKVEVYAAQFRDHMIKAFELEVFKSVPGVVRFPLERLQTPGKEEMQ